MFLLSLNGCGYKKAPYYIEETPKTEKKAPVGDDNVEFIIKEPSTDSNTTAEDF